MPFELNDKLKNLTPYEPLSGDFPIRLDSNESFLSLPGQVQKELSALLARTDFNRYPDPLAAECCAAFGSYYGVTPELLTAGNGSDELISVITGAFNLRGDCILIPRPDFSMYAFYAALSECRIVPLPKEPDLSIDPDALIEAVNRENAAMVIFSNPCNPTSLGLGRDEVRRILRGVSALVVLDEAYMDFWDQSLLGEVEEYDNLIILRTCSKMMGLAAIRLGFAVANRKLTAALRAAKSPYNVNTLTQRAGAFLLSNAALLDDAAARIRASRDFLYESLCGLERFGCTVLKPRTNFVLIRTEKAPQIFEELQKHGILVRGFADCLRITAGNEEENKTLIKTIYKIWESVL